MIKTLRIATRKSPLALWQAEYIKAKVESLQPAIKVELVKMVTEGDKILDVPLAKIGGKGLFIKELEQGMLAGSADIAVHSMKDVPMQLPKGFILSAICERENPFDAFVSNKYDNIESMPPGSIVGTSSLRRKCQLLNLRPDLKIIDLRGNVNTRLSKLDDGQYDAIILAKAGLIRLGMKDRVKSEIDSNIILPAVGQGAVGIESLASNDEVNQLMTRLNCTQTSIRVKAERALNYTLEGGCQVPIAGFAELAGNKVELRGLVGSVDGVEIIKVAGSDAVDNAEQLGTRLGTELLSLGADKILQEIY